MEFQRLGAVANRKEVSERVLHLLDYWDLVQLLFCHLRQFLGLESFRSARNVELMQREDGHVVILDFFLWGCGLLGLLKCFIFSLGSGNDFLATLVAHLLHDMFLKLTATPIVLASSGCHSLQGL